MEGRTSFLHTSKGSCGPPNKIQALIARTDVSGSPLWQQRGEWGWAAAEGRETERMFLGIWGEVMTVTKEKRGKCWELRGRNYSSDS